MKALLVCSVHALFDIATLERRAFNAALSEQGMSLLLGEKDHMQILETTSMLKMISRARCDAETREVLANRYLELLNDMFLNARCDAYKSVFDALLDPTEYARPKGFVSEYPLLTTNLARAAALLSNATKLGSIVAPLDPLAVQPMADGLAACAQSLDVSHDEVEVLVARHADFETARSIGMRPKFVKEVHKEGSGARFLEKQLHQQSEACVDDRTKSSPYGWADIVGSRYRNGCGQKDHAFDPKDGEEPIFSTKPAETERSREAAPP